MHAVARTNILSKSLVYLVTSTINNVQGIERNLEYICSYRKADDNRFVEMVSFFIA